MQLSARDFIAAIQNIDVLKSFISANLNSDVQLTTTDVLTLSTLKDNELSLHTLQKWETLYSDKIEKLVFIGRLSNYGMLLIDQNLLLYIGEAETLEHIQISVEDDKLISLDEFYEGDVFQNYPAEFWSSPEYLELKRESDIRHRAFILKYKEDFLASLDRHEK